MNRTKSKMATFLLLAFPMNQYFIVFGNFIFPLKSTWTSHHDPATPWEERERSIRELLSTSCVYMCVCVCLPVCAGARVHI